MGSFGELMFASKIRHRTCSHGIQARIFAKDGSRMGSHGIQARMFANRVRHRICSDGTIGFVKGLRRSHTDGLQAYARTFLRALHINGMV